MHWYIAKVVFNIVSGAGDHKPQFDEQYRLVKAETRKDAFEKAIAIGKNEEEILVNTKREIVRWDFIDVSELYLINELQDGMELFSSIQEQTDRKAYIETVHLQSEYVQSKFEMTAEKVL